MNSTSEILKRYLLDELTGEEREEFEMQLFTNRDLAGEISMAEEDLVESYLDETLSPAERKSFELFFLSSPRRKTQLEVLRRLKFHGNNEIQTPPKIVVRPSVSIFDQFKKAVFLSPAMSLVVLFVFIFLLASYWDLMRSKFWLNGGHSTTDEVSRLNQQDLSDLSNYTDSPNVNLAPVTLRSGDNSTKTLNKENLTKPTLLQLALPPELSANSFQVRLLRGGKELSAFEPIRFYENKNGRELRLLLPPEILTAGAYQIEVRNADGRDGTLIYFFSVR